MNCILVPFVLLGVTFPVYAGTCRQEVRSNWMEGLPRPPAQQPVFLVTVHYRFKNQEGQIKGLYLPLYEHLLAMAEGRPPQQVNQSIKIDLALVGREALGALVEYLQGLQQQGVVAEVKWVPVEREPGLIEKEYILLLSAPTP
ncbi:MAG: hypothetical protein KDD68_19390 [Bdellovibrionales bacterium]|nr:hypothetical protein [Bdellovibrionales bacterium]